MVNQYISVSLPSTQQIPASNIASNGTAQVWSTGLSTVTLHRIPSVPNNIPFVMAVTTNFQIQKEFFLQTL